MADGEGIAYDRTCHDLPLTCTQKERSHVPICRPPSFAPPTPHLPRVRQPPGPIPFPGRGPRRSRSHALLPLLSRGTRPPAREKVPPEGGGYIPPEGGSYRFLGGSPLMARNS